jgi:hypothetical protein
MAAAFAGHKLAAGLPQQHRKKKTATEVDRFFRLYLRS